MTRVPRWFRALLSILPSDFRQSHGEEICELAVLYARDRGIVGRQLVWGRAAIDLLLVAMRRGPVLRQRRWSVEESTRGGWLDSAARDVRYALRSLRRDRGFAVFAVLIIGVGIGASVTVFSVARALLLRPLPFDEPERLVWVSNGDFGRGQSLSVISVQVGYVQRIREGATQLEDAGGYHLFDRAGDHILLANGRPFRVTRLRVTENFFPLLGVQPQHGRLFTPEEAWDDGPRAIMLTHGSWERFYNADLDILGSSVTIDDAPATVVGILPRNFDFTSIFAPGTTVDYVAPYPMSDRSHRSGNTLGVIARLAPGATVASAQSEIDAYESDADWPNNWNAFHPVIRPLRAHLSNGFLSTMSLLVAGVTLVMLLVCANLSNLMLARGATRERELAIRSALGAGRRSIIQQMLMESVLVSLAGAALGVLLAVQGTGFLTSMDLRIPMLSTASVDLPALAMAVVAAVAAGLLFGVVPAFRGASTPLNQTLKDAGRGASDGQGRRALRNALVICQMTVATILLVASTLTARSLYNLLETDLGYDAENVVAIRIDPSVRFESPEEHAAFFNDILEQMKSAPGVDAVALSDMLPMAFNRRWSIDAPDAITDEDIVPFVRVVSEGYLQAMGMSLLSGRDFARSDGREDEPVVMVNPALARQIWGDADPIGRTVHAANADRRVIGVVRPTRQQSVDQEAGPEIFFTNRQVVETLNPVHLILRSDRSTEDLVGIARAELAAIAPTIPLDGVVRIEDAVDASVAPRRFLAGLLSAFAAFALVLAALGVYAVISYSVTQRKREIGIRLALGATAASVQSRISRETGLLTILGIGSGLAIAAIAGRSLEAVLFGVAPVDPVTFLIVAALLGGIAMLAGFVPARSAARANPVDVLAAGSMADS